MSWSANLRLAVRARLDSKNGMAPAILQLLNGDGISNVSSTVNESCSIYALISMVYMHVYVLHTHTQTHIDDNIVARVTVDSGLWIGLYLRWLP